jgi:hypothetical protein
MLFVFVHKLKQLVKRFESFAFTRLAFGHRKCRTLLCRFFCLLSILPLFDLLVTLHFRFGLCCPLLMSVPSLQKGLSVARLDRRSDRRFHFTAFHFKPSLSFLSLSLSLLFFALTNCPDCYPFDNIPTLPNDLCCHWRLFLPSKLLCFLFIRRPNAITFGSTFVLDRHFMFRPTIIISLHTSLRMRSRSFDSRPCDYTDYEQIPTL